MPAKPQCPQGCVCSYICRVQTAENFLWRMFAPYAHFIGPHKGKVVFNAENQEQKDAAGRNRFKTVYELKEFNRLAVRSCAAHLVTEASDGWDVYFQPNIIKVEWNREWEHDSKSDRKNPGYRDVYRAVRISLDIDAYKGLDRGNRELSIEEATEEALAVLRANGVPVTCTVNSGKGRHLHLNVEPLEHLSPEDLRDYTIPMIHMLQRAGVPVDKSTSNGVQIMRVPGTTNYKNRGNPLPVTVVSAVPGTTVTFEALEQLEKPPTTQMSDGWALSGLTAALYSNEDVQDIDLTRYWDRVTVAEWNQIEELMTPVKARWRFGVKVEEFDKRPGDAKRGNALPAKGPYKSMLPARLDQTWRKHSHSELCFNLARSIAESGVFDRMIKPNRAELLKLAKLVGGILYNMRRSRYAAHDKKLQCYYTITAINAFYRYSKFRNAIWQCYTRSHTLAGNPKIVDLNDALTATLAGSKNGHASVYRMNKNMTTYNFVRSSKDGIEFWVNRDHRDALREARRRPGRTPARVALTLKQITRILRQQAHANAPHHRQPGTVSFTGKELEDLIRPFPHWQTARALLPDDSNIRAISTSAGTVWEITFIPPIGLADEPTATDAQPTANAEATLADTPRQDTPNPS